MEVFSTESPVSSDVAVYFSVFDNSSILYPSKQLLEFDTKTAVRSYS